MAVVMRVGAALDERSTQRVADKAERTFANAGKRSGEQFGGNFQAEVEAKLNERTIERSAARIISSMARTGKTSADAFNNAIANEAARTGQAADKIGEALANRLGVHGEHGGRQFATMFIGELSKVAPQAGTALSGLTSLGTAMGEAVGGAGLVAAGGVLAIGAAAVEAGKHLYEIGQNFDNVSKTIEIKTGKMGQDLDNLTKSVGEVAERTASSLSQIGDIAGSVSVAFDVTGEPLEKLTKQIADLDRMTGENLNVRDWGKVARSFGLDAEQSSDALDMLKVASEHTLAPMGELVDTLKTVGVSARSLHLDLGQTAALIDMFDKAGLDAASTTKALNHAVKEAVAQHVDLQTVLQRGIEDIKKFYDAGDEQKAQELGIKLFGSKGAQPFIDAIRRGQLTVEDLNKALKATADAGHIERMNDATMRWADTWQIVKNRIEEAVKPIAGPVFDLMQQTLRWASGDTSLGRSTAGGPQTPGVTVTPQGIMGMWGIPNPPGAQPGQPGAPPPPPGGPPIDPNSPFARWVTGQGPSASLPPGMAPPPGPPPPGGPDLEDQLSDSGKVKEHPLPYGPGYGVYQPGETEEQYRLRQDVLEKQHDLAEKRAQLDDLDKDHLAKEEDKIKLRNEIQKSQAEEATAERAQAAYRPKLATPYAPGYGAPPRPGEPEKLYTAEQSLLEAQHKRAEALATLNQLNSASGVTDEERTKARNELAAAEKGEYEAQMKLREAALNTSKDLGALGAQIDNDFGISKGIPGIVENMTKTLANLAAAPMLGKLGAITNINEAQTGISGGYGIMGILGAQRLARGESPFFGTPLGGAGGAAGYSSLGGGGGLIGALLGFGSPTDRTNALAQAAQGGAAGSGGPGAAGGYSDQALLANVPAGRYDASGDLSKGLGDCSSAVEDLVNIMEGRSTAGRGMSTGNEAQWLSQHGFVPTNVPMPGTFQVGWNPEHTQATLPGGTNFNWGSDAAAANRGIGGTGAWDPAFTQHYYKPVGSGWGGGAAGPGIGPLPGGGGAVNVFVVNMPGGGGFGGGGGAGGGPGAAPGPGGSNQPGFGGGDTGGRNFDALAGAEASGNWANKSNPKYRGGLQFDIPTWNSYRPPGAPDDPADASKDQQIQAAKNALAAGRTPQSLWPRNYALLGSGGPGGPGPGGAPPAPAPGGGPTDAGGGWKHVAASGSLPGYWIGPDGQWHAEGSPGTPQTPGGGPAAPGPANAPAPGQQNQPPPPPPQRDPLSALPGVGTPPPQWQGSGNPWAPFGGAPGPAPIPMPWDAGGPAAAPPPGPSPAPGAAPAAPAGWHPQQDPGGIQTPGPQPAHGPAGGPTKIGGVEPASNPGGGGGGLTPGGSIDSAIGMAASALDVMAPGAGQAAQIGVKLANRAIQYGGQVAGIAASGLFETLLPTGGSELANKNWLTRIAGGIAGARPAIPNLAGGAGAGPMQPGDKDKKTAGGQQPGQTNNITINQASDQPANDITHALGVQYQNSPAMGR